MSEGSAGSAWVIPQYRIGPSDSRNALTTPTTPFIPPRSYYLVVPATIVPPSLLQRLADGGLESLLGRGAMMGALPSALEATLARLSALQWLVRRAGGGTAFMLSMPGGCREAALHPSLVACMRYLLLQPYARAPPLLQGVLAFVAGNLLQLHSHRLLATLSRGTQSGAYRIPRGGRD